MELFLGRPENTEGRLPREVRVYDFLDEHGIEYMRTDHAPADTMEVCYEIDSVLNATIAKPVFMQQAEDPVLSFDDARGQAI